MAKVGNIRFCFIYVFMEGGNQRKIQKLCLPYTLSRILSLSLCFMHVTFSGNMLFSDDIESWLSNNGRNGVSQSEEKLGLHGCAIPRVFVVQGHFEMRKCWRRMGSIDPILPHC